MPANQLPTSTPPTICWTEDNLPKSVVFDDIYFSKEDGLAETEYVFLQQNRLKERFKALTSRHFFVIGETGFGTGLNFLATWNLWAQIAPITARLHFISVEKYPLSRAQLSRALSLWPSLKSYCNALLEQYRIVKTAGFHRLSFADGRVQLTLIIDDAQKALNHLFASDHPCYRQPQWQGIDAWFLDGFAPAKNPAMWSTNLLATISKLTRPEGTLATFTAASSVRKNLQTAGFTVEKVPGFGKKRQMIRAVLNKIDNNANDATRNILSETTGSSTAQSIGKAIAWPVITSYRTTAKSKRIVILGAGLAGCHTARALADCGYQVTVIDRANTLSAGASGNAQGVVYAKLSHQWQPLCEFNLFSLLYAQNYYHSFWSQGTSYGQQCGVLQLAHNETIKKQQHQIAEIFNRDGGNRDLLKFISAQQASKIAGLPLNKSGLFFPKSGWLNPVAVCQELVKHPSITVKLNTTVNNIEHKANRWRLSGNYSDGENKNRGIENRNGAGNKIKKPWEMNAVETLVIANATDARQLPLLQWLPTRAIRGQVTMMPVFEPTRNLKTVICGQGYIAPAVNGHHCVGASFNLHDSDTSIKQRDHLDNIKHITGLLPMATTEYTSYQKLDGRVSFRCATPDYLPMVGPVPDVDAFDQKYAALRRNARANSELSGTYLPGLYLNIGYGSRGLCYTPVCAALISSIISGEPPPLPASIIQALNPARFIIRDLMRNRR